MSFTLEKLQARVPEICAAAIRASQLLDGVRTCEAPGPLAETCMAPAPSVADPIWSPLTPGDWWGGPPGASPTQPEPSIGWGIPASGGGTHWLRAVLDLPVAWRGRPLWLALEWDSRGQASLEAIVYVNGQALTGLDEFHRSALLPADLGPGPHELLLRCYVPYRQQFGGLHLRLRDESIFQLGQLMRALSEAVRTYRESDLVGHQILTHLNAAYTALDLREGWQSERFAVSAHRALAALREALPPRADAAHAPSILATGHAHLDVAWLWPLWRTRQKVAHTVANALHLMERYPDYHFSMSQPQVYAYLKEDDPALYGRMQERIAEGRFEPVGMMWLEPDCNVTGGESLVRQLVHGARFFTAEFGAQAHVVWLPDVFGYSAALPQLMRGCGIRCFMTTKISWNQFNRTPNDTFRWRGIDGSEVLTHFVTASADQLKHPADAQTYTYVGRMSGEESFGLWNHYRQKPINSELLYCYGWGDGGGGPTEEMLEAAAVLGALPGFPSLHLGRVEQYFERLYRRVWDDPRLPVWDGELYLELHRGTYTSQARTKQANRAAELRFREAEWLNAWAVSLGAASRQADLDTGWRTILLNQFHDILPGSSIAQVYVDSAAQYAAVQQLADTVCAAATAEVLGAGAPELPAAYAVLNSLPWERRETLRIALDADEPAPELADATGAPLVSQLVVEPDGARALLVPAAAPGYGYSSLRVVGQPHPAPASALVAERTVLANAELRIELDAHGEIASLHDRRLGRELVAPGQRLNQLVLYEDRPLNWDAWDIDLFYEEKPYPVQTIVDWQVVERGPLRAAVAITRRCGQSTITQRICLWHDSRRIDIVTTVDWQERQMLLRALFPLALNASKATCEIQFGAVERPTHRNTSWDMARFEVCAQRWVDLSEGDYGVALLNTGKYGHSLHHNVLGLSLLKGAIFPDPGADLGPHQFTYSLFPHSGDWRTGGVVRAAYELNAPLLGVRRPVGTLAPATAALLRVDSAHVVVETIKVADDGDGLIVRLYEAHNQRGTVQMHFAGALLSAEQTDLLERPLSPLVPDGASLRIEVRPFEVVTLRVRLAPPGTSLATS